MFTRRGVNFKTYFHERMSSTKLVPFCVTGHILSWDKNLILPMLSYPGCQVSAVHWLYWNSHDIVVKRHCYVKVTSSYHIASQRIRTLFVCKCDI